MDFSFWGARKMTKPKPYKTEIKFISRDEAADIIPSLFRGMHVSVWEYNEELYSKRIVGEIGIKIIPEKRLKLRYVVREND
jgi:hypothetical protein